MKVLKPSLTAHTIKIEPRFYPTNVLSAKFTNEALGVVLTLVPTYTIAYGVMSLVFDLTGLEGERFTLKLTENNIVTYRCKLFFTEQTIQDYKITKNKFIYA